MIYKPNGAFYAEFSTTKPSTGAAQNADALPTVTATKNGSDDATFTLTAANLATGRYKITGTVPAGYVSGDRFQVSVAATVDTVAGNAVIGDYLVDTSYSSDNYSRLGSPVGASVSADIAAVGTPSTIADAICDEALTGATHNVANSLGRRIRAMQEYEGYFGLIWIDTVNGTAGTTSFENGTSTNPSLTLADAMTLSAATKLTQFNIANGSTIILASDSSYLTFMGHAWTLALGGQAITGARFFDCANVSGVSTSTGVYPHFAHCSIQTCTLPPCVIHNGDIHGPITLLAGVYYIDNCYTDDGAILDFSTALDTSAYISNFAGHLEIKNLGNAGTDSVDIVGNGQITLNANCVGGTIHLHGNIEVIDNSGGLVTIDENASSTTITNILNNATYGLSAVKTLIDAIDTSTELAARFTEIKGAGWTTETLKAIKDVLDSVHAKTTNLPTDPADESLIIAATDAIMTRLGIPSSGSVSADILAIQTVVTGSALEATSQSILSEVQKFVTMQGLYTVTITLYETATTTPIPGAQVAILNSAKTSLLGVVTTDVNGQTMDGDGLDRIARNAGTYKVLCAKAGVTFSETTVVVDANETVTIYGTPVALPASGSADACTVGIYCFQQDSNTPMTAVNAERNKATITNLPYSYNGKYHEGQSMSGTYNATTGLLTFKLVWGAKVAFDLKHLGKSGETYHRTIPELPTAMFEDLTEE